MRHEQDEDAPPDKDPSMLTPNIPVRLEIKVTPGGPVLPRYFFKKNGQLGEVDRRAPRFVTVRAVACAPRLVSEIAR